MKADLGSEVPSPRNPDIILRAPSGYSLLGVGVARGVKELVFLQTCGSTVDTVHASVSCSMSVSPQEFKKLEFSRTKHGSTADTCTASVYGGFEEVHTFLTGRLRRALVCGYGDLGRDYAYVLRGLVLVCSLPK